MTKTEARQAVLKAGSFRGVSNGDSERPSSGFEGIAKPCRRRRMRQPLSPDFADRGKMNR